MKRTTLLILLLAIFKYAICIEGGQKYIPGQDSEIFERVGALQIKFSNSQNPSLSSFVRIHPDWIITTAHSVYNISFKYLSHELGEFELKMFTKSADHVEKKTLNQFMMKKFKRKMANYIIHPMYLKFSKDIITLGKKAQKLLESDSKLYSYYISEKRNVPWRDNFTGDNKNIEKFIKIINQIIGKQRERIKYDLALIKLRKQKNASKLRRTIYPLIPTSHYFLPKNEPLITAGVGGSQYEWDNNLGMIVSKKGMGELRIARVIGKSKEQSFDHELETFTFFKKRSPRRQINWQSSTPNENDYK